MVTGTRPLAAAAAIVADRLVGEPPAALHPVAAFGQLMAAAERRTYRDRRAAGVAHALAGVAVAAGAGLALRSVAGPMTATFAAAEVAIAGRMLAEAASGVGAALDRGDLVTARALLPTLVGRDPSALDASEVARAVIESVAENTIDAVVAPACWAAALGAPGVLAHRAVNTLDAMVGHRSARYARFGWAAARLDDIAAWVPARLTALAVVAVRPRSAIAVWRAVRHDAPAHPSPNAGVAEAAFAAALGLRLGGINRYGDQVEARAGLGTGRTPVAADIAAAVRLARHVGWAVAAALGAIGLVGRVAGRRERQR
jgi:adenosylcobinamide-phosphate synthase